MTVALSEEESLERLANEEPFWGHDRDGNLLQWHSLEDYEQNHEGKETARSLPLIDMAAWQGDPPPRRSLWGTWLPLHQTTMLTGPGGVGKSLFEQMLFTAIAVGKPLLGMETEQRNTLYVTCEDDADELWRRQYDINKALGITKADLIGKLFLCSLTGEPDTALAVETDGGRLETTDRWREIEYTCRERDIGVYAFDNATDALAADHNAIHPVAAFVNQLTGLAIKRDGAAMILHHPNKAGDDWLGSVAWHNKVRSRWIIEHGDEDVDPDARAIRNPKANYGPTGGKIGFRWYKGAFLRDDDLPADYAKELADSIRVQGENNAFLECLRARAEQGEGREVGPSPGPNYAPSQFEGMAQAKGMKRGALKRAMDRLFTTGKIETHTYRNRAKGRDVTVIREAPELPRTPTPNASRTLSPNSPEQSARTTPPTHSISKDITGAATQAAAPDEGAECNACGGVGCDWCAS
ncbi:AAA family ATPase [Qipengyuania huizhouensis]|uniref:AAA family ATPase n=1 Tax=Qipengyuania huizhouensis TaxID=2867245 RepID=UPI001C883FB7|nr:AAA family ATPase [Qipengyuania huizhouensis]MBX7460812.1 AAA family ATPase [Qipengyuania huizhouensis]